MRTHSSKPLFLSALALHLALSACVLPRASAAEVLPGVEVLVQYYARDLAGKNVGIITNPTGVDRKLHSTIDLVRELPGVNVVRLFAPEHGIRGGYYAGEHVDSSVDPVSGIPVASIYGATRRPTPEMLDGLDVILYDIQDVGSRSYTFVSTLTYMMEACEPLGIEVWVLDRPEPMGGKIVSGPMIDDELLSFIGVHTVPQVYGMTPGEWARMIQAERTPDIKLRVIAMGGWKRGMTYGDLGWIWVPPSQHIPRWETSYFYAMTGLIGELGRASDGVGTPLPFELLGAPWLDGPAFAESFNRMEVPGVIARPVSFSPRYGGFSGKMCSGVQLHATDLKKVDPARIGLTLMRLLITHHPDENPFLQPADRKPSLFDKAVGDTELISILSSNGHVGPELSRISKELAAFRKRRAKYLIYK